ncbi:Elongation factor 1-alpha [uncultured archaeon]|nr:Elongation factor 1-alpha [uncultured archaeon]
MYTDDAMIVKNIALLGHKDHGKSTLIGSMLMQTGAATQVRINEAKEYSRQLKKNFEPAFILDSFAEERTGEMTIDTTRAEIKFKDMAFALIDVPGHEELIKNMISGASYGDIALLIVSAKKDEGIRDQTKRHLFIARMLGIESLVVAVNKMDLIGYDEGKFQEIRDGLAEFITKIGFERASVSFVPISAYNGENLVKRSLNMKWYKGRPLIETLYAYAKREGRKQADALRIVTQGAIPSAKGELVVGRIVNGTVKTGEKVSVLPAGEAAVVKEITVKGSKVKKAVFGENVALRLDRKVIAELRGAVISSASSKPVVSDLIRAKILVTGKIRKDSVIKFNGVDISCKNVKVLNGISTTTGERNSSKTAKLLEAVDAEVRLARKIPIEGYDVTRELGRFVLYSGKKFAGIGIIRE